MTYFFSLITFLDGFWNNPFQTIIYYFARIIQYLEQYYLLNRAGMWQNNKRKNNWTMKCTNELECPTPPPTPPPTQTHPCAH